MNELRALNDAYEILAKLFSAAWAQPTQVPTQVALLLLHAREHVGDMIEQYLRCEGLEQEAARAVDCECKSEHIASPESIAA